MLLFLRAGIIRRRQYFQKSTFISYSKLLPQIFQTNTNSDNQVLLWDEQACLNYSTSAIEYSPPDAVKVKDEGSPKPFLLVDNTIPKRYIFHMIVIFWGQFHHNYYSKHQKLPTKWQGLRIGQHPKKISPFNFRKYFLYLQDGRYLVCNL